MYPGILYFQSLLSLLGVSAFLALWKTFFLRIQNFAPRSNPSLRAKGSAFWEPWGLGILGSHQPSTLPPIRISTLSVSCAFCQNKHSFRLWLPLLPLRDLDHGCPSNSLQPSNQPTFTHVRFSSSFPWIWHAWLLASFADEYSLCGSGRFWFRGKLPPLVGGSSFDRSKWVSECEKCAACM